MHDSTISTRLTHSQLRSAIETSVDNGPANIDMIDWMGRTALELIGQAGLGYSFDPLVADSMDEFAGAVKSFGYVTLLPHLLSRLPHFSPRHTSRPALVKTDHLRRLLPYLPDIGSPAFRAKLVDMIPHDGVQLMKKFIDAMYRRSIEIYREKIRALELGDEEVTKQVGEGKDVMSLLRELRPFFLQRRFTDCMVSEG